MTRNNDRQKLIATVEQGVWYERVWLPLLRFVHRWASRRESDYV